jgi:hypothetical protein
LRKSFMAAGTATLALGAAGIAYAQTPAPAPTATAKVSPTKAGTPSKPKAEKITLSVKNNAESKTTAAKIAITFPSTLKLSTKGLPQCTKSDTEILDQTPQKACKSSIAGKGTANALVNPYAAAPAPLHFVVTPMVGKNELLFHLVAGGVKAVLHGKISGKKLNITINPELQQPAPSVYSALIDLSTTMSLKKGKSSLITSTGCKGGKHVIPVTITYVPNPTPPAQSTASTKAEAKCS